MNETTRCLLIRLALYSVTGFGLLLYYVIKPKWFRRYKLVGHVTELIIYPVASCKGVKVNEVYCGQGGLEKGPYRDREFMVVNAHTDRKHKQYLNPKLSEIHPICDGRNLQLSAPGMSTIVFPVSSSSSVRFSLNWTMKNDADNVIQTVTTSVGNKTFTNGCGQVEDGVDCGGKYVTKWLCKYLKEEELRLYRRNDVTTWAAALSMDKTSFEEECESEFLEPQEVKRSSRTSPGGHILKFPRENEIPTTSKGWGQQNQQPPSFTRRMSQLKTAMEEKSKKVKNKINKNKTKNNLICGLVDNDSIEDDDDISGDDDDEFDDLSWCDFNDNSNLRDKIKIAGGSSISSNNNVVGKIGESSGNSIGGGAGLLCRSRKIHKRLAGTVVGSATTTTSKNEQFVIGGGGGCRFKRGKSNSSSTCTTSRNSNSDNNNKVRSVSTGRRVGTRKSSSERKNGRSTSTNTSERKFQISISPTKTLITPAANNINRDLTKQRSVSNSSVITVVEQTNANRLSSATAHGGITTTEIMRPATRQKTQMLTAMNRTFAKNLEQQQNSTTLKRYNNINIPPSAISAVITATAAKTKSEINNNKTYEWGTNTNPSLLNDANTTKATSSSITDSGSDISTSWAEALSKGETSSLIGVVNNGGIISSSSSSTSTIKNIGSGDRARTESKKKISQISQTAAGGGSGSSGRVAAAVAREWVRTHRAVPVGATSGPGGRVVGSIGKPRQGKVRGLGLERDKGNNAASTPTDKDKLDYEKMIGNYYKDGVVDDDSSGFVSEIDGDVEGLDDDEDDDQSWTSSRKSPRLGVISFYTDKSMANVNQMFELNPPMDGHDFRANIIVSTGEGQSELAWENVKIGRVKFNVHGGDRRCMKPSYCPLDGTYRGEPEPLDSVFGKMLIPGSCPTPLIGIKTTVSKEGRIRVGDPVYALHTDTPFV